MRDGEDDELRKGEGTGVKEEVGNLVKDGE